MCKRGFRGVDCSIKGCPDHCGANGYCHEGTCFASLVLLAKIAVSLLADQISAADTASAVADNVNAKLHGVVTIVLTGLVRI